MAGADEGRAWPFVDASGDVSPRRQRLVERHRATTGTPLDRTIFGGLPASGGVEFAGNQICPSERSEESALASAPAKQILRLCGLRNDKDRVAKSRSW